jgi:hypothetical protein
MGTHDARNENAVPGLIIDMRLNGGGSGFLADQMAAYFFDEPHSLGNTGAGTKIAASFTLTTAAKTSFTCRPKICATTATWPSSSGQTAPVPANSSPMT